MGARYGPSRSDQNVECSNLSGAGPADWDRPNAGRRKKTRLREHGDRKRGRSIWLDGPLAISAVEQTEFLHRMLSGSLPINANAVSAVKEITLLEKTDTYELHGK